MTTKRSAGIATLSVLGGVFCVLEILAYLHGTRSGDVLIFYAVVAGFGLYTLGSIFLDYPVTFRTTIKPTDPLGMRIFQAMIGFMMWGVTVIALLVHWR